MNNNTNKRQAPIRLSLPNGSCFLNMNLSIERKKELVQEILSSRLYLENKILTIEEFLNETWNNHETKMMVGTLAHFLTTNNNSINGGH